MPVGKLYEINMTKENHFFSILQVSEEKSWIHPLVRDTDPGIRIRTKMSRIHNTGLKSLNLQIQSGTVEKPAKTSD